MSVMHELINSFLYTEIKIRNWDIKWDFKKWHICNPIQNICNKYTKSSKKGLSIENPTADLLKFSSAVARLSVGKGN